MTKKTKPKRKWLLPATCELCNRTCTEFWGEVGDLWACEGHYHVMQTNGQTYEFKHYPEYQAYLAMREKDFPETLTDETRAKVKVTPEYKAWFEGSVYIKWRERRQKGEQWLKDNPEPEEPPVCSTCGDKASSHDKEEFYCMEHWPLRDKDEV